MKKCFRIICPLWSNSHFISSPLPSIYKCHWRLCSLLGVWRWERGIVSLISHFYIWEVVIIRIRIRIPTSQECSEKWMSDCLRMFLAGCLCAVAVHGTVGLSNVQKWQLTFTNDIKFLFGLWCDSAGKENEAGNVWRALLRKVDGVGLKNFLRFRPVMPFLKDGQFEFSFVFGELCVNQRPAYIWLIFRANTKKSSGKKKSCRISGSTWI